jgi:hypothetical protein
MINSYERAYLVECLAKSWRAEGVTPLKYAIGEFEIFRRKGDREKVGMEEYMRGGYGAGQERFNMLYRWNSGEHVATTVEDFDGCREIGKFKEGVQGLLRCEEGLATENIELLKVVIKGLDELPELLQSRENILDYHSKLFRVLEGLKSKRNGLQVKSGQAEELARRLLEEVV